MSEKIAEEVAEYLRDARLATGSGVDVDRVAQWCAAKVAAAVKVAREDAEANAKRAEVAEAEVARLKEELRAARCAHDSLMRFNVKRYCIEIVPENEQDEAYIEEVLGLRQRGECAVAMRRAPIGLEHALAYVEVCAPKPAPPAAGQGGEVADVR